jgi:ATP-dependent Lon protease
LKEKALAALRAGIDKVIIPEQNKKDLEEIPKDIQAKMEFFPVKDMDEVVRIAFAGPPVKKAKKGLLK